VLVLVVVLGRSKQKFEDEAVDDPGKRGWAPAGQERK
jgi:hypothetical protein